MYQEQNLRCFTSKLILENARKVKQIDDLQCTFSVLSVRLQMMQCWALTGKAWLERRSDVLS